MNWFLIHNYKMMRSMSIYWLNVRIVWYLYTLRKIINRCHLSIYGSLILYSINHYWLIFLCINFSHLDMKKSNVFSFHSIHDDYLIIAYFFWHNDWVLIFILIREKKIWIIIILTDYPKHFFFLVCFTYKYYYFIFCIPKIIFFVAMKYD